MKQFIRIGNITINRTDVITVYHDIKKRGFDLSEQHFVRVTTREIVLDTYEDIVAATTNVTHDFKHGTPEADALLAWLAAQTEDLLTEPCEEPLIDKEQLQHLPPGFFS